MQMQLPLFPVATKLINPTLGFYKENGFVYYLHNGSPIYCHKEGDIKGYRYICGNLVYNRLCTAPELAKAFGVNKRNIERYAKVLKDNGTDYYFHKVDRRGECHKMTQEKMDRAQELLYQGKPQLAIANELGVSESSIRYHLRNGNLKKKLLK
jgi:transposase